MRIVYSDEAGVGDEKEEPILVVAAFLVHPDQQWPWVKQAADALLYKYVPTESRESFEFKASRLFAQLGKGNNEPLLRELLEFIPTWQLPIFWGAVNRVGMKADYAEKGLPCGTDQMQNLAFANAAIMVEAFMQQFLPAERALWIADETRARIEMRMSLRRYQKDALIPGEYMTKFDHIIDTVFYGSSRDSLGIQLADACNFVIKRHHMGDASVERFFQIIYPYMAKRDWGPLYSSDDTADE